MLSATNLSLKGRLYPTDVEAKPGELVALVGPNGSGKTSLLRAMAGIAGTHDRLEIAGKPLDSMSSAERAATLAYLPASRLLEWPIPVRDLLRLSPLSIDDDVVTSLSKRLELEGFLDRPSNALSTGERARVLLARALAPGAKLLLLDEPLANLDPYWVLSIAKLLREEASAGRTIVAALHDLEQLGTFDRMLLMDDGKVITDGPCEKVADDPLFAATFKIRKVDGSWAL